MQVNGSDSPIVVDYGSIITVSWTSSGATSCSEVILSPPASLPTVGGKTWSWSNLFQLPTSGSETLYAKPEPYNANIRINIQCKKDNTVYGNGVNLRITSPPPTTALSFTPDATDSRSDWQTAKSTCQGKGKNLPTRAELNLLYLQQTTYGMNQGVAGAFNKAYWSSEEEGDKAYFVDFGSGKSILISKVWYYDFRCVDTKNLSVSLSAYPTPESPGVDYGYYSYDLIATVSGNATGSITYTFYCNRADSGTDVTSPYNAQWPSISENTKTVINACIYTTAGNYTAKVIVSREGLLAESRAAYINVKEPISHAGSLISTLTGTLLTTIIPYKVIEYSNVQATTTSSSATITWDTNIPTNSGVWFREGLLTGKIGTTLSSPKSDINYVNSHSLTLTDLKAATDYSYWVQSAADYSAYPYTYYINPDVNWRNFTTLQPNQTTTDIPNQQKYLANVINAIYFIIQEIQKLLK